jgi:hypothetical protein
LADAESALHVPPILLEGGRTEEARFQSLDVFGVTVEPPSGDNHRRKKLTSKFSRAALVAGIAIGASGLVAVPAEAANGVSTANYYVNNPSVAGAANITPESAVVSASIDTGGDPESQLPIPATGLTWAPGITIISTDPNIKPYKWVNNLSGNDVAVNGIPVSGSSSSISATITDAAGTYGGVSDQGNPQTGNPQAISNNGADNYSDVTFEYDPVSDYVANGNQPGPQVQFAQDMQVPTTTGISSVSTTIGAFGQAAQSNTGNTPLTPGTKYYYWIVQQAGGTDQASNIDVAAWVGNKDSSGNPANNSYKCYPNAVIQADAFLAAYTQPNATVTYGGTTLPADQGPCFYYYGDTSGALYYTSPNGTFTTPALGKVAIASKATATGKGAELKIANSSTYKASGTLDLTVGKKLAGTVKFALQPKAKGSFKIVLNAKGKAALAKNETVKVAPVSQTANVASVSNWDQPLTGKSVKL